MIRRNHPVKDVSSFFRMEVRLLQQLCEQFGSVRSLTVLLLTQYSEWDQLVNLQIDANHYNDRHSFENDYQVTSMLKKNPRVPSTIDKVSVAKQKFLCAESDCARANSRIRDFCEGQGSLDHDVLSTLSRAQEIISEILGPLTRPKLSFAESNMGFGPGATTSLSGVVTLGKKFSRRVIDVTPRLLDFGLFFLPSGWKKNVTGFRLNETNKFTTVPKDCRGDRGICIEPDLNIYVQKGIGALLRKRLEIHGMDLQSQDRNRYLASQAIERNLATVDLSSASDTLCREAVWLLLPFQWADLLHFARVDKTLLDGKEIPLEKWSSMGNGYTFELESLIFLALARAVSPSERWGDVVAYGDDIIIPRESLDVLSRTLAFLGFKVNHEKSFSNGRFFESCGQDFFDGMNVRPIFLRGKLHDREIVLYQYANSLRLLANRRNGGLSCDVRLFPAWLTCFSACRSFDRHRIPMGFGDVGFITDFDQAAPSLERDFGWSGYRFKYRAVSVEKRLVSSEGALLAFLAAPFGAVTESATNGREALRGRHCRATTEVGYSLEWPNLGPWV